MGYLSILTTVHLKLQSILKYIDKTGLLEYTNKIMNTLQGYVCNSRPRRFGKSITANMLTAYYSKGCDSQDLFANLAISRNDEYRKQPM